MSPARSGALHLIQPGGKDRLADRRRRTDDRIGRIQRGQKPGHHHLGVDQPVRAGLFLRIGQSRISEQAMRPLSRLRLRRDDRG